MSFRSKVLRDLVIIGEQLHDPNLLVDVITIFVEQAPLQIVELSEALRQRNLELITFHVHKLKTSADVVGAINLKSICVQIESLLPALSPDLLQIVESLQSEVKLECTRITDELNTYLYSIQPQ